MLTAYLTPVEAGFHITFACVNFLIIFQNEFVVFIYWKMNKEATPAENANEFKQRLGIFMKQTSKQM